MSTHFKIEWRVCWNIGFLGSLILSFRRWCHQPSIEKITTKIYTKHFIWNLFDRPHSYYQFMNLCGTELWTVFRVHPSIMIFFFILASIMAGGPYNYSYIFKYIIIGDMGTGKSSILHQFTEKKCEYLQFSAILRFTCILGFEKLLRHSIYWSRREFLTKYCFKKISILSKTF